MTNYWSLFITIGTIIVIGGCFWLLRACSKNNTGIDEDKTMGHSFDGIEELNNPLPKWWSYMFYASIAFAVIYLILYPGLGNYKGLLNWQSSDQVLTDAKDSKTDGYDQYQEELKAAKEKYGAIFKKYSETPIEELIKDPEAVKLGKNIFLQNCTQCHGSNARGSKGFPNLTANAWNWGGTPKDIETTILNGRKAMMMPKGGIKQITDEELAPLVEYIRQLGNLEHDEAKVTAGKATFMKGCFACHGMDGKGNKLLGSADLTDKNWLYGASREDILKTITYGRIGEMPKWKDVLGTDKVHLVATYVYYLANSQEKAVVVQEK